ncbi:hypothetical protein ANN_10742 [Periplaneta americana]|uniref:NB-ARC domain-containing protein n=1 Tax=Periplaneta americana TaxID=6978 RepID=A0ABQ8T5E3_PERAM|nr:hypothetical protein ANN_10742 [Periplaneta americana]
MSSGSSTDSYPAFAHVGLRENPGKNLYQVTCPDRESNHEPKELFGPRVQRQVDELTSKFGNICVTRSSSEKLTSQLQKQYLEKVIKTYVKEQPFLLILDSWEGQQRPTILLRLDLCLAEVSTQPVVAILAAKAETLGHVLGFCRKTELLRNNRHHKARTGIADVLNRRGWETKRLQWRTEKDFCILNFIVVLTSQLVVFNDISEQSFVQNYPVGLKLASGTLILRQGGCIYNRESTGRPPVSEETLELVRESLTCSPRKSTIRASKELQDTEVYCARTKVRNRLSIGLGWSQRQ